MKIKEIPIIVNDEETSIIQYDKKVTKRDSMAYAAGIGAVDDIYLSDDRPQGIVAPLSYSAALEWPIFEKDEYLDLIGRDSHNIYNKFVHGFQDSIFYKPVRPGDDLSISGCIVQARDTSAGTLLVTKLAVSDRNGGELLTESWFGSMYMKTPLTTKEFNNGRQSNLPSNFHLKDSNFDKEVVINIPKGQAHVYTECSQIWNPVHTEREFAHASGLDDIILHGTCTWAKSLQALAKEIGRSEFEKPFFRFGARFTGFVIPGSDVLIKYRIIREGKLEFIVINRDNKVALNGGVAEYD
jgi:acyl dehydratase